MSDKKNKINANGFGTTCIHGGFQKEEHNAHITPIYASSTYIFDSAEQAAEIFTGAQQGYVYGRFGNPTITAVEEKIAALETHGISKKDGSNLQAKAILHASGMAAISTLFLSLLKSGDAIISHNSLYGGTQEFVDKVLPNNKIETIIGDLRDLQIAKKIFNENKNATLLYLETPANPTLQCVDLAALCELAHAHNMLVAVDNTFATPYLQQPFAFGADFIIHSTTKFLNGHGTAIGGILIGTDLEFMKTKATKHHRLLGANTNAFDAFLLNNGIKTLEIRMEKHCANAMQVAQFLNSHSKVEKVNYLGLENNVDYLLAQKQMQHAGALLSFELKGGIDAGRKFLNEVQLCTHAVSLGTCDTLVSHPASTTHVGVKMEDRTRSGITDGLIRMSVGIENIEDILLDLRQSLEKC
jgi:methionine-gamma-lyase